MAQGLALQLLDHSKQVLEHVGTFMKEDVYHGDQSGYTVKSKPRIRTAAFGYEYYLIPDLMVNGTLVELKTL